ncbi:AAA family ATPase [Leptothoe sp. LEGE 181152]|nr:AAA family ATPase [Leptothoe sp. LEGE 181152]
MFKIVDFVQFDSAGRAQCPCCLRDGKKSKNLALVPDADGAYKCHRGHSAEEIREALGQPKARTVPPPDKHSKAMVSPQKVKQAHETLMGKSVLAKQWLINRGITESLIKKYQLGIARTKVGDAYMGSISIPIPNAHKTAYWQKKRVGPWLLDKDKQEDYRPWSQWGIPQMVYFTHHPPGAIATYLCEGEWDAMVLGHLFKDDPNTAIACFTCGAGNIPPVEELDRLPGDVVIFYDLDEAGRKGADKLSSTLGRRSKIAQVPTKEQNSGPPKGWDISDYLLATAPEEARRTIKLASKNAIAWEPPPSANALRERLVTNDELMARAADYTDWLVDDILTADELFLLAASPRAGKSLMAFTLAKDVATGGKFLGRPTSKGAVIYVRCEDSETKTKERELKQGWGEGLPVYWLDKFKLNEVTELEELVEELGARLVVFDTLSRIRDSSISESSAEMSQLLEPLQEMCKRQRCCGLLVHHTGKVNLNNAGDIEVFDTIRGSSAIRATCRGTLILAADDRCHRLHVENGWGKLDLQIVLDAHTLNWKLIGNWKGPNVEVSQKDRVLEYLNKVGASTLTQIAEQTNLPKKSLYEVLKRLQADDMVEKRGQRQGAIYTRKAIQQIQQLNTLLNCSNADTEKNRDTFSTPKQVGGPPQKSGLLEKSEPKDRDESIDTSVELGGKVDRKVDLGLESSAGEGLGDADIDPRSTFASRTSREVLNKSLKSSADGEYSDSTAIQHYSTSAEESTKVDLNPGDIVRYIGSKSTMSRLCGRKHLKVLNVENEVAVIQHKDWAVTQSIVFGELKLLKRKGGDGSPDNP